MMDEILLKELDDYFTCDKISESQTKELMETLKLDVLQG